MFTKPKISQDRRTRSLIGTCVRGSGFCLFGVVTLGLSAFGCGNRDGGNGDDDGGIGVPATQGGSESQGAQGSGSEGTTSSGGDIELPPETGGETGETDGAPCESFELDLKPKPTSLMLVIDRSGSMVSNEWDHDGDDTTPEKTRWFSLHGVVEQVTGKFDGSINFGAQIFPGASDKDGMEGACAVAGAPEVTVQAGAREKILAGIPGENATKSEVFGATPTYDAYASALAHLNQVEAQSNAKDAKDYIPPAIVLITDGGANCTESYFELQNQVDNNITAADCDPFRTDPALAPTFDENHIKNHCINAWYKTYDDRVHTAVEGALNDHQIKTYVIGIGIADEVTISGNAPNVNAFEKLNDLATKGGAARENEEAKFFSANNQDSLLSALDEIAASVASCSVPLETPIPPAQAPFVELSLKNKDIPFLKDSPSCEGKHGWRWTSEAGVFSSMELCGEYCQELKLEAALDVVVGCEPPA